MTMTEMSWKSIARLLITPALIVVLGLSLRTVVHEARAAEPDAAREALQQLETLRRAMPDESWERDAQMAWYQARAVDLCIAAERFIERFPDDPRRWRAAFIYDSAASSLKQVAAGHARNVDALLAQALEADDIRDEDWSLIKSNRIRAMFSSVSSAAGQGEEDPLAAVRRELDVLAARVPAALNLPILEAWYADALGRRDPALRLAHLRRMADSDIESVARQGEGMLRYIRMRETLMELKFTAIDGREVDLEALRGKVVLVDFWAMSCGPCLAELPNLKAVYEKYHDKGFEVVGIALDGPQHKQRLLDFVAEREMPWPQYLDEENRRNRLALRFGINSIPAPLLLNQEGLLVHEEARGEALEEEVRRLIRTN